MWPLRQFIGQSVLMIGLGMCFLAASSFIYKPNGSEHKVNKQIQNFPIHAITSFGHREFAWTLLAIEGLAATVNIWNTQNTPDLSKSEREKLLAKFEDSLNTLPGLAEESLGMREVFTLPASFLAFELNDIDKAISVARQGARDIRLEADLALSIAFLTHIFKGDLSKAADDYDRVAVNFPTAGWLRETSSQLRRGIDPSKRPGKDKTIFCKMLANAFPLAKKRLVQRGLCTPSQIGEGSTK